MSRFLSHDKTKGDYLAAKILEYNRGSSKLIVLVTPNYHLLLGNTNKWMDC